ncbi:MAG: tRNA 5-methoxyuridine(34)/uridine 5-oxyacetic acid(34) synthase CmoB [Chloroflexota bacterium]
MILNYSPLYELMSDSILDRWLESLPTAVSGSFDSVNHGKFTEWLEILEQLPNIPVETLELKHEVKVETAVSPQQRAQIEAQLRHFHPWRKGPFTVHGIHIDTEWRSDWKWDRLINHIQPLTGRRVLDVGCGNGYHCWRMVGAGARLAIGIDPFLLYVMQFHAMRHFLGKDLPTFVLPFGIDEIPTDLNAFDTVFSMGVLYHRRSPIDHLLTLKNCLRSGGELVLETLVINGRLGEALLPEGRYAQMRNVWFIPSPDTLQSWLRKSGFTNVKLVDVSVTTEAEQRSTEWMTFHSLKNFLDSNDVSKTVEGYPAPQRAILTAVKP